MFITKMLSQHHNDFSAMLECEHCHKTEKLTTGYNDNFYHQRVIPAMRCTGCGLDRAGSSVHTDSEVSPVSA